MKRLFLFVALSFFYTSAMVVVGGYNVSSEAAQLWNKSNSTKKSGKKPLGSSYYNSRSHSSKANNKNLFNSRQGHIKRKVDKGDRMAYEYLKYENRQRSKNRAPAVFAYMSAYSVSNRLDDIETSLTRQAQRKRASEHHVRKMQKEAAKFDSHAFKKKNRENLLDRIASSLGSGRHQSRKSSAEDRRNQREHSSNGRNAQDNSESQVSTVGQGTKLYNSLR